MKKFKSKFLLTSCAVHRIPDNGPLFKSESLFVELEFVSSGNTTKIKTKKLVELIYKQLSELK